MLQGNDFPPIGGLLCHRFRGGFRRLERFEGVFFRLNFRAMFGATLIGPPGLAGWTRLGRLADGLVGALDLGGLALFGGGLRRRQDRWFAHGHLGSGRSGKGLLQELNFLL